MASVQKVLEFLAAAGVAQLAERLGLDLADALARDIEFLADLLKRAGAAVLNAEAQLEDLLFARGQGREYVHQLLLQQRERRGLARLARALVGNEVAEVAVLLLADGGLQRDRLLRDLEDLAHLVHGHTHLGGDLVRRGVVAERLEQLAGDTDDLVDGLDHVEGCGWCAPDRQSRG